MSYKQGDIVSVWFPDSNLLTVKKRPGIVLQKDNLNTNLSRKNHASRIFVDIATPIGQATGLTSNSVIMTDNMATIPSRTSRNQKRKKASRKGAKTRRIRKEFSLRCLCGSAALREIFLLFCTDFTKETNF